MKRIITYGTYDLLHYGHINLLQRAKALIPVLIPLFVSSIRRADDLATAMECRCYRGDKNRTKLVKLEFRARDMFFILIILVFLAAIILAGIMPYNYESFGIVYDMLFYKV